MILLVNILAFQIGWLACVLGAANSVPQLGPAIVVWIIALHMYRSYAPERELALVAIAALVGTVWDSALVALGWIAYPSGNLVANAAPYWIVAMWMLFATTLNVSLRWLRKRLVLAAIIGVITGPLAYLAGARLGGVTFVDPRAGYAALALGWAVLLPFLIAISARLDGMTDAIAERARV